MLVVCGTFKSRRRTDCGSLECFHHFEHIFMKDMARALQMFRISLFLASLENVKHLLKHADKRAIRKRQLLSSMFNTKVEISLFPI